MKVRVAEAGLLCPAAYLRSIVARGSLAPGLDGLASPSAHMHRRVAARAPFDFRKCFTSRGLDSTLHQLV